MTKLYRFVKFSVSKSHLKFIFLFYKDQNVSFTHSVSQSVTQSVSQQKVSSNRLILSELIKTIILVTLLIFPTWKSTLRSKFFDFWFKIFTTETCQKALLSTKVLPELTFQCKMSQSTLIWLAKRVSHKFLCEKYKIWLYFIVFSNFQSARVT